MFISLHSNLKQQTVRKILVIIIIHYVTLKDQSRRSVLINYLVLSIIEIKYYTVINNQR